tara:strand:- start:11208 stop:12716 length:1509 start_codon:yes stop_codon:yes gene_type:complete
MSEYQTSFIVRFCDNLFDDKPHDDDLFIDSESFKLSYSNLFKYICLFSDHTCFRENNSFYLSSKCSYVNIVSLVIAFSLGLNLKIINDKDNEIANQSFDLEAYLSPFLANQDFDIFTFDCSLIRARQIFEQNCSRFSLTLFTSGSTSAPKPVTHPFSSLAYQAVSVSEALSLRNTDRQLAYMPISYIYGFSILTTALYSRSCLAISSFDLNEPDSFFRQLYALDITVFSGIPYVYNLIYSKLGFSIFNTSGLRILTQAGGPLKPNLKQEILKQCPNINFWIMYGQTEFGGRISQFNLTDSPTMINSVGVPLPGTLAYISSVEESSFEGNQFEGDIYISSPSFSDSYSKKLDTKVIDGIYYYATGDIGYISEGYLFVTGRNRSFLKIAGKRINVKSIQDKISEINGIDDCFLFYVDRKYPTFLIGLVTNSFDNSLAQAELKSILISAYRSDNTLVNDLQRVPFFTYVIKGDLPLLPNSKLNLAKLEEIISNHHYEKKSVHIRL